MADEAHATERHPGPPPGGSRGPTRAAPTPARTLLEGAPGSGRLQMSSRVGHHSTAAICTAPDEGKLGSPQLSASQSVKEVSALPDEQGQLTSSLRLAPARVARRAAQTQPGGSSHYALGLRGGWHSYAGPPRCLARGHAALALLGLRTGFMGSTRRLQIVFQSRDFLSDLLSSDLLATQELLCCVSVSKKQQKQNRVTT